MQALALAAVIGLLALLTWKLTHDPGGGVAAQLSQGKRPAAPNFTLPRLDGRGSVELASIKKPRVVDFFASWCYACPHESTRLEKYSREYGGRIAFLGGTPREGGAGGKDCVRRDRLGYTTVRGAWGEGADVR